VRRAVWSCAANERKIGSRSYVSNAKRFIWKRPHHPIVKGKLGLCTIFVGNFVSKFVISL
jgi:hypothetical protein